MNGEAIHQEPIWRERSDFIIGAGLAEDDRTEQLWARQIDDRHFEVCCIPFFLYDVSLGDIVETDDNYNVVRVTKPSGRYVFRIWFDELSGLPREGVVDSLHRSGALLEWSSANFLAVDAKDANLAQTVADFLHAQEQTGGLIYETGRTH